MKFVPRSCSHFGAFGALVPSLLLWWALVEAPSRALNRVKFALETPPGALLRVKSALDCVNLR